MENSIGNIVSKIDAVLNKMAAMDRAKVKRRENMNKILNTIAEVNIEAFFFLIKIVFACLKIHFSTDFQWQFCLLQSLIT